MDGVSINLGQDPNFCETSVCARLISEFCLYRNDQLRFVYNT